MRYIVTLRESDNGLSVYEVADKKKLAYSGLPSGGIWKTDVWVSESSKPKCVGCRGPLTAMSSSCAHVRAVKRHIKKFNQEN